MFETLIDILLHPENYVMIDLDRILVNAGTLVASFIETNPKFCVLMAILITWIVQKTPWKWDDSAWEKLKGKFNLN
ncbi:MAG TPA: hypothetical protein PLR20_14885 [Syntrophales bacterium]|nr:hypothetical protein [Syntrophales bacterium]